MKKLEKRGSGLLGPIAFGIPNALNHDDTQ